MIARLSAESPFTIARSWSLPGRRVERVRCPKRTSRGQPIAERLPPRSGRETPQVLRIVAAGELHDAIGHPLGRDDEGVGILHSMNLEPEFGERGLPQPARRQPGRSVPVAEVDLGEVQVVGRLGVLHVARIEEGSAD